MDKFPNRRPGIFANAKKPSKRVLLGFGIVFGLLTLATAPSAAMHTYQHAIADGAATELAFGKAAVAFGAVTLLWALHAGLYLFIGCVMVPRIWADLKGIGTGIARAVRGTPAAYRATIAWLGRCRKAVASLPDVWFNMTGRDRFALFFTICTLAIMAGIGFLNWGFATAIHAWLPKWMQLHDFMGPLYIDVFMTAMMSALIMPFLALLARFVGRMLFKKDKNS